MLKKKEVENHAEHLSKTFENLLKVLFTEEEWEQYLSADKETVARALSSRAAWVKISDIEEPGINTKSIVLIHLLWLQSIGRVKVEDVDPLSEAILVHFSFDDLFIQYQQSKQS